MRLAFDMDGTITEGRYLPPPRTPDMYMNLAPYDNDTLDILQDMCHKHEVFIITARSETRADKLVRRWLWDRHMNGVWASIITNPFVGRKNPENAIWKAELVQLLDIKLMFDDSPYVYEAIPQCKLVDNKSWSANQQVITTERYFNWKEILETIHNYESH